MWRGYADVVTPEPVKQCTWIVGRRDLVAMVPGDHLHQFDANIECPVELHYTAPMM